MDQHHKNTTDNYSLQDLGLKCSAWKRLCLNYPKLMQIIRNLAEIGALPRCIRNKSSEIRNLFSAKIPSLLRKPQIQSFLGMSLDFETTSIGLRQPQLAL